MGLVLHIVNLSPQFLKHSFVKREQSDMFNKVDRLRVKSDDYPQESVVQIDFAENYVCEAQDEVQSAHWNQRQLTLFTSATFHQSNTHSKIFVSNNLSHTKETIVPYLYKLLLQLPPTVTIVKIWSDGPSSQFKNKFIAAIIPLFEKKLNLKIFWNFFATSHGKGCVDGIGATAKMLVRRQVLSRKFSVNSATDFANALKSKGTTIEIEEVTDAEVEKINKELNTALVFTNAKNVKNIASSHHLQVQNDTIISFLTSKLGYSSAKIF